MNHISSRRLSTTTWVRWRLEGGFGGIVGNEGSIAGRGGDSLAKCSMESNDGLGGVENKSSMGLMLMANGEECLDGWVRAGGGEVTGGVVDFGVIRSLLGEIPGDIMGERGGEACGGEVFGVDGGAD
ncbi:hypothetical protein Tco_1271965 [Tanacetum coccineum]